MSKIKYRFNPETLQYDRVSKSLLLRFVHFLPRGIIVMMLTSALLLLLSNYFESPQERSLRIENEQLMLQYKIMNEKICEIDNALDELKKRDNNIYRIIFETNPLSDTVIGGIGGVNMYKKFETLKNAEIVIGTAKHLDILYNKYLNVSNSLDRIFEYANHKKDFLESVPSISPISDRNFKRFASGFGLRLHPIYKTNRMHTGIDLTAPTGTLVYTTGKGKVVKAGYSLGGYGNVVIVDHGFGYSTVYGHLQDIKVVQNQKVNRGDAVGTIGSTGRSVAPHLHYEVRYNDTPVNPVNYYFNDITPEEYDQIVKITSLPAQSLD